jgi:hypothetical protein
MFLSKRQPSFEPAAFLQNTQHVVEMQGFCPKETALLSPKKHFRSDFFSISLASRQDTFFEETAAFLH